MEGIPTYIVRSCRVSLVLVLAMALWQSPLINPAAAGKLEAGQTETDSVVLEDVVSEPVQLTELEV